MACTVTRYQCEFCGAYVTWRNTPDGRRAFGESNRRHDYQLRPVGDEYHGRHRLEDGGIPPGRSPEPIDWSSPIVDPEFEAWLRSVTPPPYP